MGFENTNNFGHPDQSGVNIRECRLTHSFTFPFLFRLVVVSEIENQNHHRKKIKKKKERKSARKLKRIEDVVANIRRRSPDVRDRRKPPLLRRHHRPRRQRLGPKRIFSSGTWSSFYFYLFLYFWGFCKQRFSSFILICCLASDLMESVWYFDWKLIIWLNMWINCLLTCMILIYCRFSDRLVPTCSLFRCLNLKTQY